MQRVRRNHEAHLKAGKVRISARAMAAMNNELCRFPDWETGGLLLGYFRTEGEIFVLEATDGGYQNTVHEPDCFQYDVAYEDHLCEILSGLYRPPLELVGLWHKHNERSDPPFSNADENMHRQLLEGTSDPGLSILFEKLGEKNYGLRVFLLSQSGAHTDVTDDTILEEEK